MRVPATIRLREAYAVTQPAYVTEPAEPGSAPRPPSSGRSYRPNGNPAWRILQSTGVDHTCCGSQQVRQLLACPAISKPHAATSVTGLCHAACGNREHAARQALTHPARNPYLLATLIPRLPRPRVVMPAAGSGSSRHANAPMRNGVRSAGGCCLSSRPLRISLRVIPGSSPVAVATIHLYPGRQRAVDLNASRQVLQPLQQSCRTTSHILPPVRGLPPAALIPPGPPPPFRPRQTSRVLPSSRTRRAALRIMPPRCFRASPVGRIVRAAPSPYALTILRQARLRSFKTKPTTTHQYPRPDHTCCGIGEQQVRQSPKQECLRRHIKNAAGGVDSCCFPPPWFSPLDPPFRGAPKYKEIHRGENPSRLRRRWRGGDTARLSFVFQSPPKSAHAFRTPSNTTEPGTPVLVWVVDTTTPLYQSPQPPITGEGVSPSQ